MVGGGGSPAALPDQVIPNSATQRLIAAIAASGQAVPRVVPGAPVNGDEERAVGRAAGRLIAFGEPLPDDLRANAVPQADMP